MSCQRFCTKFAILVSSRGGNQRFGDRQTSNALAAMVIGAVKQIQESTETQSNRLTRGGARLGCSVPGSTVAAFLSKWVSILSMTTGGSV